MWVAKQVAKMDSVPTCINVIMKWIKHMHVQMQISNYNALLVGTIKLNVLYAKLTYTSKYALLIISKWD